jgi:hypothetical protein
MNQTFFFIGTISRDVPENEIENEIKTKISTQQAQFNTGLGGDNPENLEIIEYAYTNAEPNCRIIYAKWKIK